MIEMRTRIDDKKNDFVFPGPEDEKIFRSIVTQKDLALNSPAYRVWHFLIEKGWWHNCSEGKNENFYLVWHYPENDLELLEEMLHAHDWYYSFSDDNRVYLSGNAFSNKISNLMEKINSPEAQALYNKYCPYPKKEENESV